MDLDAYSYPQGLTLLQRWQAGEAAAKTEIKDVFDAAIAGEFDLVRLIIGQVFECPKLARAMI